MRLRATGPDLEARNTSPRAKKKPAKEIMIVVDNEGEEEGEKAAKASLPTSLDQALATAFSLDSANPNVAAKGVNPSAGSRTNCGEWKHAPTA